MKAVSKVLAAGLVAAVGGVASAEVILSYGYTDLNGSFDAGSGQFSAVAGALTAGDVTRIAPTAGTANFDDNFAGRSAFANVVINISVFNKVGNVADGVGTFVITDEDGDQLVGDIIGTWINGLNGIYFNGDLSNVDFVNVSGDTTFDGTDGGSFETDLPGDPPYIGAYVQLFLRQGTGGFFTRDWSDISVQAAGEIVPSPGTAALLGLAGVTAIGVRRRRLA